MVMSPFERAKASAAASKHFFLLLLGMQADGGCTHFAFTDGSKVGAEASRGDGAAPDGHGHLASSAPPASSVRRYAAPRGSSSARISSQLAPFR